MLASGDSAALSLPPPHTVESSADDVLRLLRSLKIFPHMLIGHSYGGKVGGRFLDGLVRHPM